MQYNLEDGAWAEQLVKYVVSENNVTSHGSDHGGRVFQYATEIDTDAKCDTDILFAASYLHDIGRIGTLYSEEELTDNHPIRYIDAHHPERGLDTAKDILQRVNFPEEKIDAVLDAIASHETYVDKPLHHRKQQTLEEKVLSDADRLDAIGHHCIRGLAFGEDWRPTYNPYNNAREELWTIGHKPAVDTVQVFESYIKRYHDNTLFFTDKAKEIAKHKIEYMEKIVDKLKSRDEVYYYTPNDRFFNFLEE